MQSKQTRQTIIAFIVFFNPNTLLYLLLPLVKLGYGTGALLFISKRHLKQFDVLGFKQH